MALLIAFFSAWRTAQMSQTFALRQAEASVTQVAREILRRTDGKAKPTKRRSPPPHEREIYERFGDSPTSLVALAQRGNSEVSGGFCDLNGGPANFISADSGSGKFSASEMQIAQAACGQINLNSELSTQTLSVGGITFFVASATDLESSVDPTDFIGAFAFRRISEASIYGDWLNLLIQAFLLVAAIGMVAFSFSTWRDWQQGMRQVEEGLAEISDDLAARIHPPKTPELEKISLSINDLTAHLESNLRREAELERSLVRSEKLAGLGRVVAGIAHEVRNPLASMKLKIQLAERGEIDSTRLENTFAVLREEIGRLDNLVRKLLDLSRPAKLVLTEFSLAELVEERVSLLSEKFDNGRVRVEFDAAARDPQITGDREKLVQVFDNLLMNAAEAMPNGGTLRVEIAVDKEKTETRIIDEGPGVSTEIRERLFEPFFTTKDRGTGLGLAISREITEAHGGRLYFAERNTGATFVVELPRSPDLKKG